MEVHGPTSVGAAAPIQQGRPAAEVEQTAAAAPASPRDEVDISSVGKMLDDMSRTPGVREERLARIKAAIENGTYDTLDKLERALSRMIEQITQGDNDE